MHQTAAANKPAGIASGVLDAPRLLAMFQAGQHRQLEARLKGLIQQHPRSAFLWSLLGATLQTLGKDGLTALQKATVLAPDDSEAHGNLGTALHLGGRPDEAEASYRRAIALSPGNLRAGLNLGSLLLDGQRFEPAEACFRQVLSIAPQLPEAHVALGNTLARMSRPDEAERAFRKALEYSPDSAEAWFCLGNLQRDGASLAQAKSSYLSALRAFPGYAPAYNNLGNILLEQGCFAEAVGYFQKALHFDPGYCEAHSNLALAFVEQHCYAEAAASYRRALQIMPQRPDLHGRLGYVLKEMGRLAEAEEAYQHQLQLDPAAAEAKLALAFLTLPAAPADVEAARQAPGNFARALHDLARWVDSAPAHRSAFVEAIGAQQPFHLAYRDGNHIELLSRYGDLAERCFATQLPPPTPGRARIRLLVIANQIHRHSVWDIVLRGLLMHLDRTRFELSIYHTGLRADEETVFARSLADTWRDRNTLPYFDDMLAAIRADGPDAILYPEIGMDPFSFRLAAHRLARLQMASWGHPISSGLATIDLYLSGELLESAQAQAHYRERLVCLPGTGCCTSALDIAAQPIAEIEALLEQRRGTRFVIAQRAFKLDPLHDTLYADIAAAVGDCCFVLLQDPLYPWASTAVLARLKQTFRQRGLDPERHFLEIPWLDSGQFFSLLDAMDIFLDCPAFSGYTTAWQALHRGLPIVTRQGPYLRQRLAAGLLHKIGMPGTIAHSTEEYVAIAVRLASDYADPVKMQHYRATIRAAAPKADGDIEVVRAFEQLIMSELAQRDRSTLDAF